MQPSRTIAVVGANGQVGSEVCLFLQQEAGIIVRPIVRARLGSAFLRRCGLECEHGRISSVEDTRRLLDGCDLIADFSLPRGLPSEAWAATRSNIDLMFEHSPPRARIAFISSTMAFGMGAHSRRYGYYRIPRTPYSAAKRDAEAHVMAAGRSRRREAFVLRLGAVHGELQAVSRGTLRAIRPEPARVPGGESDCVFAYTIAQALTLLARGVETPGVYTLVENPDWTWRELYLFYARKAGIEDPVIIEDPPAETSFIRNLAGFARKLAGSGISKNRDLILANMPFRSAALERRLKAENLRRAAAADLREIENDLSYTPFHAFAGRVPGRRLVSLPDSRPVLQAATERLRETIRRAAPHDPRRRYGIGGDPRG